MLKNKFLHRRSRTDKCDSYWKTKKYWKTKNIYLFSDLPFHQSIKKGYHNYDITPLMKFIESKIGCNWNDVYSEILTKIHQKYKHTITSYLNYDYWYGVNNPIYDEDFIPRSTRGKILSDCVFIENGILVKKTEQQILSDAKKFSTSYYRREKMRKIIDNIDGEDVEGIDDIYKKYMEMDGKKRMERWKRK